MQAYFQGVVQLELHIFSTFPFFAFLCILQKAFLYVLFFLAPIILFALQPLYYNSSLSQSKIFWFHQFHYQNILFLKHHNQTLFVAFYLIQIIKRIINKRNNQNKISISPLTSFNIAPIIKPIINKNNNIFNNNFMIINLFCKWRGWIILQCHLLHGIASVLLIKLHPHIARNYSLRCLSSLVIFLPLYIQALYLSISLYGIIW